MASTRTGAVLGVAMMTEVMSIKGHTVMVDVLQQAGMWLLALRYTHAASVACDCAGTMML
jgi:hypothetical protein